MLTLQKYRRKQFLVEAVEVTPDNIYDVARWCSGEVLMSTEPNQDGQKGIQKYVKVAVNNPLKDRQTRAYYGDWVLLAKTGFKVYVAKAFVSSFERHVDHMVEVAERMDARAEQEEKLEFENDELTGVPPASFVDPVR